MHAENAFPETGSKTYDVIVVGGGPGGASTSLFLAKKGYHVLLLEKAKYPRDKICGDAISGKSVGMLKELGLDSEMESIDHAKVYGLIFSSPEGKVLEIPFPMKDEVGAPKARGYVCRRIVFDNFLFSHAKKMVDAREEYLVTDFIRDENQNVVVGVKATDLKNKKEHEFRAKFVVVADGATSLLATKLGAAKVPDDHLCMATRIYYKNVAGLTPNIEIHFVDSVMPGYFWIFPLDNGMANIGLGMVSSDRQARNLNLVEETEKVIANHPLFKERFKNAEKLGDVKGWTLPFGSFKRTLHGPGWLLVGDAASLVDPFSGEGVGNAMTSGKFASEVIDEAIKTGNFSEEHLATYDARLWAEIGKEMDTSYMLQKIGRHKWLLNLIIGKASKSKEVRDTISGMLVNENARKSFISPMFYVKLLFA